jgi:acyl-CoA reductase-like NAD-dependent aldehyde dehydrogenase
LFLPSLHLLTPPLSQNSGQNCIGIERFVVHSSQHDELVNVLGERARKLRCGSILSPSSDGYIAPVDCGAMINSLRFAELERLIDAAVEEGATLEVGGRRWRHAYLEDGSYFGPTILANVDSRMEIAQTEGKIRMCFNLSGVDRATVFAPIALILKYETIEEAIEIANGTRYGLGASVFGPDQNLCQKVARRLECGMVSVNDYAVFYVSWPILIASPSGLTNCPSAQVSASSTTKNQAILELMCLTVRIFRLVEPRRADMVDSVCRSPSKD